MLKWTKERGKIEVGGLRDGYVDFHTALGREGRCCIFLQIVIGLGSLFKALTCILPVRGSWSDGLYVFHSSTTLSRWRTSVLQINYARHQGSINVTTIDSSQCLLHHEALNHENKHDQSSVRNFYLIFPGITG